MTSPAAGPAEMGEALAIYAGDRMPRVQIEIGDPDTGAPDDLTVTWQSWRAQWRPAAGSGRVIDLVVDTARASIGIIEISLDDGALTEQMGGPGLFDVQATDMLGRPQTFLVGATTWRQDVTR